MHTGIDAKTVQAILKGFQVIDYELSEILGKVKEGWKLSNAVRDIPADLELPPDIAEHIKLGLPLLERQTAKLKALVREHLDRLPRPAPGVSGTRSGGWDDSAREQIGQTGSSAVGRPEPVLSGGHPGFGMEQLDLFADSSDQLTFDLFGEPPAAPKPSAAAETPGVQRGFTADIYGEAAPSSSAQTGDKLTERQQEAVTRYLREGVQSARIICELLIRNDGAIDRRFLTQKPVIYPAVCRKIDGETVSGAYKLVSKDENDRVYERAGE
ncbi:hypothetical protein DQG23_15805 [Paenibacillus contaminans]|uniref:Uncharacterized protein n=2 Tax=Paenibacillus contaminans TaxID=450362 RepID=A0A329ML03_9BACL|nr:hypothetical protein DQG23_15805 [Paenibacillus contaminans]